MLPTKFRFIWPSGFRGEDLKRSANQKQELPKAAIFVNGWDKMSNLERGPSIDVFYQISLHLAEGFQRKRLKCEKLTDDRRRMPSDGKSSHCHWQGELKSTKMTNNDLQNITHKTKYTVTRTPLETGGELRCSGLVSSSCSISGTCHVTPDTNLLRNTM